jgi:hypothetical protein
LLPSHAACSACGTAVVYPLLWLVSDETCWVLVQQTVTDVHQIWGSAEHHSGAWECGLCQRVIMSLRTWQRAFADSTQHPSTRHASLDTQNTYIMLCLVGVGGWYCADHSCAPQLVHLQSQPALRACACDTVQPGLIALWGYTTA